MSTNYDDVHNHIKRRKANLIRVLGGKCCICGFDKYQEALEFHHVNPEEKEFGISNNSIKALDKQLKELRKCILVCSNCHKGIHAGYEEVPENWQDLYQDEVADQLLAELDKRQVKYCVKCGKEISHNATYCSACYGQIQQKVGRPTRQELKDLIRTLPFTQIAQRYNVTDNSIRKWCKKEGLPHKKSDITKISNADWEKI